MLLEIQQSRQNGVGKLSLSGVLDISTVDEFNNCFEYFQGVQELTIDFAKIEFIDSTGIGGLVQIIKKCNERRISLKITNIHSEIFEILDILGLPEVFGNELFEVIN